MINRRQSDARGQPVSNRRWWTYPINMARDVVTRHQRVSVDLQKVVMLPRLPGFKAPCFANRLVDFHHTFAPVRSHTTSNEVESNVWHEGTSGRKCEDIALADMKALETNRDFKTGIY